jgi:hypothetical protein
VTARRPPAGAGYDLQRDYTTGLEPFWFRWADQWWDLPHLKMLDFETQLQVISMQDQVAEFNDVERVKAALNDLFTMLMGAEQAAEFAKVDRPIQALMDMLHRWRDHSGDTEEEQGESSASAGSSPSTGRPSKRTSSGSTASASPKRSSGRVRKTATPPASS